MQIQKNVSLKDYSTMRLGGIAQALAVVTTQDELVEATNWARQNSLPILVLGGGSNVIFSDGYPGLVIVNRIMGYEIVKDSATSTIIKVGAGENWDSVVSRTVERNLHGIELLSGIPGTTGATPVQNVGAYGGEIAQSLIELTAYDQNQQKFVVLQNKDCGFSYRNSIFKDHTKRHHIIINVTLKLTKQNPSPPFYDSLQQYLTERGINNYTPQIIREAVLAVRSRRLPDPAKTPNTGSFFKNPIVSTEVAESLQAKYPNLAYWPLKDGRVKLAAGWLLEHAGLKDFKDHGMATYHNHALVIINESAKTSDDLLRFKQEIIKKVKDKFGVTLEQEPELL